MSWGLKSSLQTLGFTVLSSGCLDGWVVDGERVEGNRSGREVRAVTRQVLSLVITETICIHLRTGFLYEALFENTSLVATFWWGRGWWWWWGLWSVLTDLCQWQPASQLSITDGFLFFSLKPTGEEIPCLFLLHNSVCLPALTITVFFLLVFHTLLGVILALRAPFCLRNLFCSRCCLCQPLLQR